MSVFEDFMISQASKQSAKQKDWEGLARRAEKLLRSYGCDYKGDLHLDVQRWLKELEEK